MDRRYPYIPGLGTFHALASLGHTLRERIARASDKDHRVALAELLGLECYTCYFNVADIVLD